MSVSQAVRGVMLVNRKSKVGKSGEWCWQVGKVKSVSQGVRLASRESDVGKSRE